MSLQRWYTEVVHAYAPRPRRPYEYLVNHFYAHRIDPVLTWLADRVGLSPNSVTLMSLAVGLVAAGAIISEDYLLAAVCIQLHHLLDGVDGNLARAQGQCTEFGKRLDQFSDRVVNLAVFVSLAYVADVPAWLAGAMLTTVILDLLVVRLLITPFMRTRKLLRSRWKQWFMDRGLMPAFDIFTIYFVISICLVFRSVEAAVMLVTVLKTLDWSYRLYECARTWTRGSRAETAV